MRAYSSNGRNARLLFTAPTAGVYTIRITPQGNSTGTYFFSVEPAAGDAVAPRIVRVIVDGSNWSPAFRAHLAAIGAGVGNGYALPTGSAAQSLPLPWTGINRVHVQFSEHVDVVGSDLSLWGVAITDHTATTPAFSYDEATFTATWSLPSSIPADKLLMILTDRIEDAAGNSLDGDWTDGVSLQSGDGTSGGDFAFRFNVLPGDVNQNNGILGNDVILTRNAQFRSTSTTGYSAFLDVNGSGTILGDDLILVRNRQFTSLPLEEPGPPGAPLSVTSAEEILLQSISVAVPEPEAIQSSPASRTNLATLAALFSFSATAGDKRPHVPTPSDAFVQRVGQPQRTVHKVAGIGWRADPPAILLPQRQVTTGSR